MNVRWRLILLMERWIKHRGLWVEYRTALGFPSDDPPNVPLEQVVIWGVPYYRRLAAFLKVVC